ncbi:MAG: Acyl-CoA thioesterase [uncultured Sulfurovum sp.]|uniref:Acyl-CoA thioesterase n=1 Tax=uncultured Sulfurovum sp. TaxID=269237 RepID=A0A6S6SHM8_9BACT|nr:MAG: Acyl-CoA thioesterase [uncultured Sulfurovum sp.]
MKVISIRGRVFPTDLNHAGTVFGGWLMGQMDKAASIAIEDILISPAVTAAVSDMNFLRPVYSGAIFTIYTEIVKVGNSSVKVAVDVQIKCRETHDEYSVTNATFTFVIVDENKKPRNVREVLRDDIADYIREQL